GQFAQLPFLRNVWHLARSSAGGGSTGTEPAQDSRCPGAAAAVASAWRKSTESKSARPRSAQRALAAPNSVLRIGFFLGTQATKDWRIADLAAGRPAGSVGRSRLVDLHELSRCHGKSKAGSRAFKHRRSSPREVIAEAGDPGCRSRA